MRTSLKVITVLLTIASVSCVVPKKQFLAMQHQRDSLQNDLTIAHVQIDSLNNLVQLQRDTIKTLRSEVSSLNKKISDLNEQYNNLSDNYKQLRSNSTDEIKKLIKDLETSQANLVSREKRLQKVEDIMKRRDESVNALKDKLSKALLGFNKSGLSVTIKDGKVYVSLTDKLLFNTGSIVIDDKGKDALAELAKVLETQADINVLVEGHTDNVKVANLGQIKDNWDLSVMRATSVVRFLTDEQNLDPLRITASGKSEYLPVDKLNSAEARSKNRRIEIILTPKLDELYQLLNEEQK